MGGEGRRARGEPILMKMTQTRPPFKWGPPLTTPLRDLESDGLQQLSNYDGRDHRSFLNPKELAESNMNAPFADSVKRWRSHKVHNADYPGLDVLEAEFKSRGHDASICSEAPFRASQRGDLLEAPWPMLVSDKMCLYKPDQHIYEEPGFEYTDEAMERRREQVRREKRLGKSIDEEYGGLQSHSVFASEVPRFVDQQHSVESAEFSRLTGQASLNAGKPPPPEDGGPRGRARRRVSSRKPDQRPTSSLASTSTRGMYDYWPTCQSLKGWRNAPGPRGRQPEPSMRPYTSLNSDFKRISPCFMPTNIRFPDDLDLLYATMKKSGELKRLDDDTCSTDRWRRQKLREEMAEAEKRELEEVSRTFMTEAPVAAPVKKRDIRVF